MRIYRILLFIIPIFMMGCENTDQQSVAKEKNAAPAVAAAQVQGQKANKESAQDSQPTEVTVQALALEFEETEQGAEPYPIRMLITDEYIRIDEAGEQTGYVLFDRKNKRIYSVLHDSEKILVVDPLDVLAAPPEDLVLREEIVADDKMPSVGGNQPVHYQFYANDTLCYHVVAIDGFLPEATRALKNYQAVLAAQQQETVSTTPKELQTPCFLSNYIYSAENYMSKGFPFEQWDIEGYRRSLINFEEKRQVRKSLFALPAEYGFFSLGGAAGGTIM